MALEIKVGPPQLAVHHGYSVLLTEPDGSIPWPSDRGLYVQDTRIISAWDIYANGERWELLSSGTPSHDLARIFLTNPNVTTEDGTIIEHTLELAITRRIGGGVHEDLDLRNHGATMVRFNLEIAVRSDFADIFEVKSGHIVRRGHITTDWEPSTQSLTTTYINRDFRRVLSVRADRISGATHAVYANGRISFEIALDPGGAWHACLLYGVAAGEHWLDIPAACTATAPPGPTINGSRTWQRELTRITCSNANMQSLITQAVEDMAALRLPFPATAQDGEAYVVPAAGLPWFVALFGRDSLIVSLQSLIVWPEFARGALDVLGRWQARERDDWRDAEPGKILHELRQGELAHFKLVPHTPYYGTADATPLYLIVLHAAWRATGDRALLERFLPNAEAALDWIDNWGDRDGDGFQEFATRSPVGYENMSWKDSGDSMSWPDGSLVKGPKAVCELQGYVYDAWLRMAEVYDALARPDRARALRAKAAALFEKFNATFWNEDEGYYAYMLDGEKRPVWSVASDPGHLLYSGIVPEDRAARVAARLLAADMDSGWGIRTLSAAHHAYNPYSYQNGSVWPHDNGIIAAGFKRYGLGREAAQIARAISGAAGHFLLNQVPELYAGLPHQADGFPVQYLGANVPQAWAAGSAFMLVQAMLGLEPDAPRGALYIDPWLPPWLPDLTLTDLRLGGHTLDIRFHREGDVTNHEVLRGDPTLVQTRDAGELRRRLRDGTAA